MEQVKQLSNLLTKLDVPFYRHALNKSNLTWLSKNLKKKNSTKSNYQEAQNLVDYCLINHLYKN